MVDSDRTVQPYRGIRCIMVTLFDGCVACSRRVKGFELLDVGFVHLKHPDGISSNDKQGGHHGPKRCVHGHASFGSVDMFVKNLPEAIEAVEHGQGDHAHVPQSPNPPGSGVGPATGYEGVVDILNIVGDVHDEEVANCKEDQRQA